MIYFANTIEQATNLLEGLDYSQEVFGYDIETTGLDPMTSRIRLVAICDGRVSVVVDYQATGMFDSLKWILQNKPLAAHNHKFEYKFFAKHGWRPLHVAHCSMIAEKLLVNGTRRGVSLQEVVLERYGTHIDKELQGSDWSGELTVEQISYNGRDAYWPWRLYHDQVRELKEANIYHIYELEMKILPVISNMELTGIVMDRQKVYELYTQVKAETDNKLREIQRSLPAIKLEGTKWITKTGKPTKKARELFPSGYKPAETRDEFLKAFTMLGVAIPKNKEGKDSLSKETYGKIDHPVGLMLEEYFKTKKMLDSYLTPVLDETAKDGVGWINKVTGRVHASINQLGTATGRFSMQEPAFQTIPRKDKRLRLAVIPPDGRYEVMKADYSQIEMRIMAEVSGDTNLINAYVNGEDIHKMTASNIYGVGPDSLQKEQRQLGKNVNFGCLYGQFGAGLKTYLYKEGKLDYPVEQCREFVKAFFETFPGIKRYHEQVREVLKSYLNTDFHCYSLGGRRRTWSKGTIRAMESTYEDGGVFIFGGDIINHPVQSTVGDIMKLVMVRIAKTISEHFSTVEMILQVHDELVFYVPQWLRNEFAATLRETMIDAAQAIIKKVPIEVEISVGPSWGETEVLNG